MGFFKKVGKAVGGAVKSATKVVSLKNAINLATNPTAALSIAKEATDRALKGAVATIKPVSAPLQQAVALAPSAAVPVVVGGKTVTMTAKNAAVAEATGTGDVHSSSKLSKGSGDSFTDWIKTGVGGAAAALGVKLAGNEEAAAAAGDAAATIGKNTAQTWLKSNWWKVLLPVAAVVGLVMYFKKGGKRKTSWR